MENIFDLNIANQVQRRINALSSESMPLWGKMNVAQMLAHCNVTYHLAFDESIPKVKGGKKFFLKLFVKPIVVNEKPYSRNGRTAPDFLIVDEKNFKDEKSTLIANIKKAQELGQDYFDGRESHSFGALSGSEWNNMFYKHLDHHLNQFGV